VSVYHRILPDRRNQPLLDPDFPTYNFDALYGLTYEIDLRPPPRYTPSGVLRHNDARRIRDLRHENRPVADTDQFLVATDSHRAASFTFNPGARVLHFPQNARDMLISAIRGKGTITPQLWPVWHFAPIRGAEIWFDTAPAARACVQDLSRLGLVAGAITPEGYLRIRMDFTAPGSVEPAQQPVFRRAFGQTR
ncbi:MAG TPA: hypothetical protein VGC31_10365, partial [Paenirhodobacter sp.]